MKHIKKIILFVTIATILILTVSVAVFAYLNTKSTKEVTASTDISSENVIEIASFDDLFTYSKASAYNDDNEVSSSSSRNILKLTSNIDLAFDLEVTADVHLNLNAKTLNLNEHTLKFRHGYAGCFSIYGGIINTGTSGGGKITVDLSNASFVTNNVTYYNNVTVTEESACIDVLNIDSKYTSYQALRYVSNAISSDINQSVEVANYTQVSDSSYELTQDKFIVSKTSCSYNSNSSDVCSYVYKDLDLPMHYLSTDVDITYTSSNTDYLSNYGKVTLPTTEADVNLTVSINHSSWNSAVSCTFKLHVVNLSNSTVKNNVANNVILDLISGYYVADTLVLTEKLSISNYYNFDHAIQLPLSLFDGNITYSYSMTDYDNQEVTTTSHTDNNYYVLEPNQNCFHLLININSSTTMNLNMYSTYVSDYETIARLLINSMYGGSIVYDSSVAQLELYKISDLSTVLSSNIYAYISQYNITAISYALKESSEATTYYTCSNNILTLKDGAEVPPVKTSYMTISFTFGSGGDATVVDIDVYIDYLAESGDTLAGFLRYYNVYDPIIPEELFDYFEMPFDYYAAAPYTCYDVSYSFTKETTTGYDENFNYYTYTLGIPNCLDIILYYNGAERYTFTTSTTSLTNQLDSYMSANNLTLSDIASYGDAKYIFRLDVQNALTYNLDVILIYNYKFNESSDWSTYSYTVSDNGTSTTYLTELNISTFQIKGGLFYNASSTATNAVQDKYFFTWIYNNFNPNEDSISYSNVDSSSFIPIDWLSLDVALDVTTDSSLANVTNYAGIGNLTRVTKVNLSGVELSPSVVSSIASMTSVIYLDLSGCSISDITDICEMNTLKTLDVSNNSISYFYNLVYLENLIDVYVYGNQTSSKIYGSLGILNFQTYNDLIRNGISVYNQVSNDIGVLYADSDDYNDYVRIKSIIYQDKLSTNESITSLYSAYKDFTYSTFGLDNKNGKMSWGYQTVDHDGNTYDEHTATYFYCNYVFSGYTLTVKYYVDRY
jgi:hypothetical protein